MATRRSRLQVKPNLGGPKIGGSKQPPSLKIPDRSIKKAEAAASSPLKSPRVTSPVKSPRVTSPVKSPRVTSPVKSPRVTSPVKSPTPRVTSPLKSPRVPYPIRDTPEKPASPLKSTHPLAHVAGDYESKKQEKEKSSLLETKQLDETENNDQVNDKRSLETTENTNDASEKPAPAPKRARLRRFGTVNVGIARGAKAATPESKPGRGTTGAGDVNEKNDKETGNDQEAGVVEEAAAGHTSSKTEQNTENKKINLERKDAQKDIASTSNSETINNEPKEKVVQTPKQKPIARARLPKVKPNFQDASRKRPKSSEENAATSLDVNLDGSPQPAPSTSVATGSHSNQAAISTTPTTTEDALPVKHTLINPKPTLPKSPRKSFVAHPLQTSPVKSGGKMLTGERDKWSRPGTVSTSEPHVQAPPQKKVRRSKVDAPVDKPPDRTKMKMRDLIRWNPSSNPMKVKEKHVAEVKDIGKEQDGDIKGTGKDSGVEEVKVTGKERPAAEVKDTGKENEESQVNPVDVEEDEPMPVPQVTIGPDGNIVINEKSLVVKNDLEDKGPSQEDEPIDETEMFSTYGTFRKVSRSRKWSEKDTAKFYKALAMVGIDFFLIQKLFPNRQRFELKKKFKIEERKNGHLIERVLRERLHLNESIFENVSSEEEDEKERRKREQKEKKEQKKKEREEKKKKENAEKKKTKLRTRTKRPYNHFEPDGSSSDSEAERQLEKNFQENPDVPEKQPGVSKSGKDREVVSILMDMSEGRLPGSTGIENDLGTNSNGVVPELANQSNAENSVTFTHVSSQDNLIANLPQHIPGFQSIITVEAHPIFHQGFDVQQLEPALTAGAQASEPALTGSAQGLGPGLTGSVQVLEPAVTGNVQVLEPGLDSAVTGSVLGPQLQNTVTWQPPTPDIAINQNNYSANEIINETSAQSSASPTELNSNTINENQVDISLDDQAYILNSAISNQLQSENAVTNSNFEIVKDEMDQVKTEAQLTVSTPAVSVPDQGPNFGGSQIISQQLLSPRSVAQFPGLENAGPDDQYVLVTVMPESGQETVIHVYRLHGGQLTQ